LPPSELESFTVSAIAPSGLAQWRNVWAKFVSRENSLIAYFRNLSFSQPGAPSRRVSSLHRW